MKVYDIIIVGSGVGGLSTLLYINKYCRLVNQKLKIAIIAKGEVNQTNTGWAQGGIASVKNINDSFEKHIQDTLIAGVHLNDKKIVEKVIKSAPNLMEDLIEWGMELDKNQDQGFDLAKEGGHSEARIWHYKDITGWSLQKTLFGQANQINSIDWYLWSTVCNIEQDEQASFHLQVFQKENNNLTHLVCKNLVLATGGLGCLYQKTTNQTVATGDGIYFAKKLGATIKDLSFIQFHPTGLFNLDNPICFLITEAIRGAGAIIRNIHAESFMKDYDPRGELAPRDIVSRAVLQEMKKTNSEFVYLDATKIDSAYLESHFPTILKNCLDQVNLDIRKDYIPIIPVQHYLCGGIVVDEFGQTTIENLYAIGECANTGLHGANRLASNSLLEGLAFAKFAAEKMIPLNNNSFQYNRNLIFKDIKLRVLDLNFIQKIMSENAFVSKRSSKLKQAIKSLLEFYEHAEQLNNFNIAEFENNVLYEVGLYVLEDALKQPKNIGVHFNEELV